MRDTSAAATVLVPEEVTADRRRMRGRMRSNRTFVDGALEGQVRATGSHASIGMFDAKVLDLSIHGVRLALDTSLDDAWEFAVGDTLDPLRIACGGRSVYAGAGAVTRAVRRGHYVELGVQLETAGMDLDQVHRSKARLDAAERWRLTKDIVRFEKVDTTFRAWVMDLADFLGTAQRFLDREERALSEFDLGTRTAISEELLNTVGADIVQRMNRAGDELGEHVGRLPNDLHREYRGLLLTHLGAFFATSPFFFRAKGKPLGYAGDYEMMNMLYRDHAEGTTLFGRVMNLYATELAVARANINRIDYLGTMFHAAIAAKPSGRVRIASIGCGPAQEVVSFLTRHPECGGRLEVSVIDQEPRAIAHCERVLAPLATRTGARIRVIEESARRLLTERELKRALGECDLIYSAGLFDYLVDRTFGALLAALYGALAEGGTLAVGNVALDNPNRWAMEYFSEWFLHHRSPSTLQALGEKLSPTPRSVHVESEPLGVNLFLIARR